MLKGFAGIGLVLLIHLVIFLLLALLGGYLFILFLLGLPVLQLVYVLPLAWWFRRQKQSDYFKGVLIGAGLTLLLSLIAGLYYGLLGVTN